MATAMAPHTVAVAQKLKQQLEAISLENKTAKRLLNLVRQDKPLNQKAPIDWRLFVSLAALLASGCSGAGNSNTPTDHQAYSGSGGGILASMRPKANPELVEKIRAQERANGDLQSANAQGQSSNPLIGMNGLATRVLPKVSTDPIAPPAEEAQQAGAMVSPVDTSQDVSAMMASNTSAAAAPIAATYGSSYNAVPAPPPGALGGALVPPPPAVTLTTQAQTVSAMPDPNNPYMNPYGYPPYMNPYGMAYPAQQPAAPQPRPSGLFGNGGGKSASSDGDDSEISNRNRKNENFVPITPTGMEARSAYKQRDDLKVLWKGLLSSNNLTGIEPKALEQLNKLDVGLPSESTKGNFSISQRQVDVVFKPSVPGVDRKLVPQVRKSQADLIQAYSRYLYTYNKFALAQQTLMARKQEVEVASSNAEQQRAAADLAQAQTELDSTKDDMRSAQIELAQASSPAAARAVIGKVSGVAPSMETLVSTDQGSAGSARKSGIGGFVGSVESMFTFGHGKSEEKQPRKGGKSTGGDSDSAQVASAKDDKNQVKASGKDKNKKEKHAEKSSGSKTKIAEGEKSQDLSPAPVEDETASQPGKQDAPAANAQSASPLSNLSFALKGVNVTARKSILTVAIKNSGTEAFTFNPDVISVSDGNRKLPDAAMRADFDSTLVQPNQEVKGTITIFGRPWNDRLSVSLSDSGHTIQLRR
jgi:hypothetical protein